MSKFNVTGISTLNGKTKVRFANDLVSRVKILNKEGHTDIELKELAEPLTKLECVKHLKTTELYEKFSDAIDAAEEKYTAMGSVKVPKAKKEISLEDIKSRAVIDNSINA
jgi:hypothetical protein